MELQPFLVAEHHSMPRIASSATSMLIGLCCRQDGKDSGRFWRHNATRIMHRWLSQIQFGTLEAMYPGRIDLGLGRAPGSDQYTAMALR